MAILLLPEDTDVVQLNAWPEIVAIIPLHVTEAIPDALSTTLPCTVTVLAPVSSVSPSGGSNIVIDGAVPSTLTVTLVAAWLPAASIASPGTAMLLASVVSVTGCVHDAIVVQELAQVNVTVGGVS